MNFFYVTPANVAAVALVAYAFAVSGSAALAVQYGAVGFGFLKFVGLP